MRIPDRLRASVVAKWGAGGEEWLANLADIVSRAERTYGLQVGEPFHPGGASSVVAPCLLDGTKEAVAKFAYGTRALADEAAALRSYGGRGAVQLYVDGSQAGVIVVERCAPGHPAASAGADEVIDIIAGILPRLWGTPVPARLAPSWHETVTAAMARLVSRADSMTALELSDTVEMVSQVWSAAAPEVLLHGDMHGRNALRARREPWLAIDPKPLTGPVAYDAAGVVLYVCAPQTADEMRSACQSVSDRLQVPIAVLVRWCLARSVESGLWCSEMGFGAGAVWNAAAARAAFDIARDY